MIATAHVEQRPAKSRAQILRDSVEIRLAVNDAGPLIAEILKGNGIELPHANWDAVFPHWLLATHLEEAIGCCQVLVSKPVGYVEFLFVRPDAPFKLRAIAIRKLIIQSMATLYHGGCQYVGGVVGQENKKFADVIRKLNFVRTFPADLYIKRLT